MFTDKSILLPEFKYPSFVGIDGERFVIDSGEAGMFNKMLIEKWKSGGNVLSVPLINVWGEGFTFITTLIKDVYMVNKNVVFEIEITDSHKKYFNALKMFFHKNNFKIEYTCINGILCCINIKKTR